MEDNDVRGVGCLMRTRNGLVPPETSRRGGGSCAGTLRMFVISEVTRDFRCFPSRHDLSAYLSLEILHDIQEFIVDFGLFTKLNLDLVQIQEGVTYG